MQKSPQNVKNEIKADIYKGSLGEETSIENDFEMENVKSNMDDEEGGLKNTYQFSGRKTSIFQGTFTVNYLSKYWLFFCEYLCSCMVTLAKQL